MNDSERWSLESDGDLQVPRRRRHHYIVTTGTGAGELIAEIVPDRNFGRLSSLQIRRATLMAQAPLFLALVEEIASMDPLCQEEDESRCFFCGGEMRYHGLDLYFDHEDDCLLVSAQEMVARVKGAKSDAT